jgi:drug/metabolite transporter (DMT)-like permease
MLRTEPNKLPAGIRGGLWMASAAGTFTIMTALIRAVAAHVHPIEIAFFRALTNLLLMIPFVIRTRGAGLKTKNHKVFAFRGLCGFAFLMTYFPGAALIPVDQSQALIFTAPLWVALLAVLFLGEGVRAQRLLALIAGFAGALIILRPGVTEVSPGTLLVVAAALANATSNTIVKFATRTDHPDTVVFYLMVYVTPMIFVPALFVWTWPTPEQLLLLFSVGLFATLNQRFLSRAFAAADATAVLPFYFVRLPFAAIIGFLAFGELPEIWVWVGGAVIFAASFYIAHREVRAGRQSTG